MSPSPKDRLRVFARSGRESETSPLLSTGLFDPWYYALQTRDQLAPADAVAHYLREGAAAGLLPNPLTDVEATGLSSTEVVDALLDGSARTFPVRLVDDLEIVALAPSAAEHPGGPVGHYLQHAHAGAPVPRVGRWSWKRFVRLREQQSAAIGAILASGLVDRPFYEAQAGRTFVDDRAAVWHFLETGESPALSPSPLYERAWYRSRAGVRMPMTLMHLLRTGQVAGAAGPHFDGATYLARVPEAAEHPGGALGHFLAHAGAETSTVPEPGSGIEPVPWPAFREGALGVAAELGRQAALLRPPATTEACWHLEAARPPTGTGAVAIVADVRGWGRAVPDHLATVLAQEHRDWTLRLAVDADASVPAAVLALADDPRVVLVPTAEQSPVGRLRDVLVTVEEPWTAFWRPCESWSPLLLGGLLSEAAPDALVHAAVVDDADGRCWGALAARESLAWDAPRSLAGVLVPTDRLREVGLADVDRPGLDLLLRHGLRPVFVPFVGVRGGDLAEQPTAVGRRSVHEQTVRLGTFGHEPSDRVAGRVSVLVVSRGDRHRTRRVVDRVLERSAGAVADLEVVVVDNGSDREITSVLSACYAADARVRVDRVAAVSHHTVAADRALALSTGEVVVLLDPDVEVHPGWLPPLLAAVARPDVIAAQSLLLTADDTIWSAGLVSAGPHVVPVHLLGYHPLDDLPAADPVPDAVSGACVAVRADVLVAAGGLDPAFDDLGDVDLSLRLADASGDDGGGRFVTVLASRASRRSRRPLPVPSEPDQLRLLDRWGGRLPAARADHWERAGLEVDGFRPGDSLPASGRRVTATPLLSRRTRLVTDGPGAGLPSLRWAVKIAARGGPSGDEWGDTFFAADLVRGLRSWGQEAFVDRRGAHERPGVDHLDDVTLTLRGRWPSVAQPGATNVLWVISHPDEVPLDELTQGFDLVYSAGRGWAQQVEAATSLRVRTLLQATDSARFTPVGEATPGLGTLFVGRTRKVARPIVRDAVQVGADLTVFGDGWHEFIDAAHVAADHLPNERLPAAYRGARVVLNDHWTDMARLGFYSNRLFDAVASGARVVSDAVDGLEDVLGPSARTYRTTDDLRELLDPASPVWPDEATLAANASRVAAEHSFEARARTLLADVLDVRGVAHDL
ncbi:glycosyltransferase family protein [Aeromicrobium fastidiosum]|nr:glycosyltransferase [Aeromicrobium fastidiosum]MBP2389196.1 hypothetical protein [Aeromicrobium fastidiosum]